MFLSAVGPLVILSQNGFEAVKSFLLESSVLRRDLPANLQESKSNTWDSWVDTLLCLVGIDGNCYASASFVCVEFHPCAV